MCACNRDERYVRLVGPFENEDYNEETRDEYDAAKQNEMDWDQEGRP